MAPSTVNLNDGENVNNETTEQDLGCHPCNKLCVYCQLLSKTEADHFKSVQTVQSFKIRQPINCQSKDIIYLVNCVKCNLKGLGSTTQFNKRISNYFSHIKQQKEHAALLNISLTTTGKNGKSRKKKIICFKSLESVNLPTSQQMEN